MLLLLLGPTAHAGHDDGPRCAVQPARARYARVARAAARARRVHCWHGLARVCGARAAAAGRVRPQPGVRAGKGCACSWPGCCRPVEHNSCCKATAAAAAGCCSPNRAGESGAALCRPTQTSCSPSAGTAAHAVRAARAVHVRAGISAHAACLQMVMCSSCTRPQQAGPCPPLLPVSGVRRGCACATSQALPAPTRAATSTSPCCRACSSTCRQEPVCATWHTGRRCVRGPEWARTRACATCGSHCWGARARMLAGHPARPQQHAAPIRLWQHLQPAGVRAGVAARLRHGPHHHPPGALHRRVGTHACDALTLQACCSCVRRPSTPLLRCCARAARAPPLRRRARHHLHRVRRGAAQARRGATPAGGPPPRARVRTPGL